MKTKLITITTLILSTTSATAWASGFSIMEQSISGLGRAYAGSAAVAEDASTIFYNPAGLSKLDRAEFDAGMSYIAPVVEFHNAGSTSAFGADLTGGNGADAAPDAIVPILYYAKPIDEKITLGIGINAPFGLVTEYGSTWKGRYHADKSMVQALNINPSFAYKASDKLSVGFGISLQKAQVELSQYADLGAKYYGAAGSQTYDGKVKLEADDWSWGYNLGLLLQATESTRVGISYRSDISHKLSGKGRLYLPDGSIAAHEHIKSSIDLPEMASLSVQHQLNPQWSVMADATWTRWSRFKELAITSSGGTFNLTKPENWEDTMRYSLGVDYKYNDSWTFRTGVAFDEAPMSLTNRTARLPDGDRRWISVGASYKASDTIIIDAGYTHIFLNDPKIYENNGSNYILNGKYDVSFDLIGAQIRWLM